MRWWKWFAGDGDGPFDIMIGIAALCVIAVILFIGYGLLLAILNGVWQPFAFFLGLVVFLLLCLSVGHVTRIFFHDTLHNHKP